MSSSKRLCDLNDDEIMNLCRQLTYVGIYMKPLVNALREIDNLLHWDCTSAAGNYCGLVKSITDYITNSMEKASTEVSEKSSIDEFIGK